VIFVALLAFFGNSLAADQGPVVVFAAASMTEVLEDLGEQFQANTGQSIVFSFAGSSTLARQIDQGAPADVFVSANPDWIDFLDARGRLVPGSIATFASGALVAVAPKGSDVEIEIDPTFAITDAFKGRLAIADPAHVPAGKYAKEALLALGWWNVLSSRLAVASDVRGALTYVDRGACDLGIVYATDATISSRVKVVAVFPDSLHSPIRYLAAAVGKDRGLGHGFVAFLASVPAARLLGAAGFWVGKIEGVGLNDDEP
jgi:molybdate transport system substrate-binding protein